MKLAVVGGGSTYTPELIDGFARRREVLPIEQLWLVDPDPERLRLVSGMSQRMFAAAGHPCKIVPTDDLIAGVSDADAVLIQLRVGWQDARHGDETFPHVCGCIGQETTGAGGFAKALRTVPVVLEVAEAVRRYAQPTAWIVEFTNPVGIVTRALLAAGHRAVGLCNVAITFQRKFAALLGIDHSKIQLGHVGLNHLSWERSVQVTDGDLHYDALPELLSSYLAEIAEETELPAELIRLVGNVPSYYLRYFYCHDAVYREQVNAPTRAQQVQAVERELLKIYADPAQHTKPEALSKRGGAFYSEAAVDLLAALRSEHGSVQVVNVQNSGALPFLPEDHVIEVPARVSSAGLATLHIDPVPAELAGLISDVAGYERLALQAALHGSRAAVQRALLAHPLVRQYEKAEKLTDALLANNKEYLAWAN
jgi:6-phospho-beta-glucosidase